MVDRKTGGVGYGIDDPNNNDTGFVTTANTVGQIRLNQVAWATVKWDVTEFFELGFEVSHRETHFIDPANARSIRLAERLGAHLDGRIDDADEIGRAARRERV